MKTTKDYKQVQNKQPVIELQEEIQPPDSTLEHLPNEIITIIATTLANQRDYESLASLS